LPNVVVLFRSFVRDAGRRQAFVCLVRHDHEPVAPARPRVATRRDTRHISVVPSAFSAGTLTASITFLFMSLEPPDRPLAWHSAAACTGGKLLPGMARRRASCRGSGGGHVEPAMARSQVGGPCGRDAQTAAADDVLLLATDGAALPQE
jgi:hypothetical protein